MSALSSPRVPLVAALVSLALTLPALWNGLQTEDRTQAMLGWTLHMYARGTGNVFQNYAAKDLGVPILLRMFEKRLRGYRAIDYARGEAPLGYAEPKVVEYDDDVLRSLDHDSATDRDDDFAEWAP